MVNCEDKDDMPIERPKIALCEKVVARRIVLNIDWPRHFFAVIMPSMAGTRWVMGAFLEPLLTGTLEVT